MKELPDGLLKYAETAEFTAANVPDKLTAMHETKPGVWGKLIVIEGSLDYILDASPHTPQNITIGGYAIIEPTIRHKVRLYDDARFKVEFYRSNAEA